MTTRTLVSDDGVSRRYRVLDDTGKQIGSDVETVPTPAETNERTLRDKAAAALVSNRTYLALATPTTAQSGTQIARLTRQVDALIRLVLAQTDDISDT